MNDNAPAMPAETQADALYHVRDDLETLSGKLSSLAGLAGFAGMRYSESDHHLSGMFFSIQNLAEAFYAEANDLVQRLMELERGDDGRVVRS